MILKSFFKKIQYELVIFLLLFVQLLVIMPLPQEMNSWCVTSYFLDYSMGFNSRFLIGSLFKLLFEYFPAYTLYVAIFISLILLNLLVAVALGKAIRGSKDSVKMVIMLAAVYLASPASIAHLYGWRNYGRFDIYLIAIAIASLYLINTKAGFLIPVLAVVGMAIHQVFAFSYMSIILFALLINMYENEFNKRSIILAVATVLAAGASFIYFQFLTPGIPLNGPDQTALLLQKRTNMPISNNMLFFEYFASWSDHMEYLVLNNLFGRATKFGVVMILVLPLSMLLNHILGRSLKLAQEKKLKLLILAAILLPVLMLLPAFALTTDWGRWLTAIYTFQFAAIIYLAYKDCAPVKEALSGVQLYFEKNLFMVFILIAYLSILGKFEDDNILDISNKIIQVVLNITGIVRGVLP